MLGVASVCTPMLTPNIVGPTTLGVLASVCMQPKRSLEWRSFSEWSLSYNFLYNLVYTYNNTNIYYLHQFFAFYLKLQLLVQAFENTQLKIVFSFKKNRVLGLHILRGHEVLIKYMFCLRTKWQGMNYFWMMRMRSPYDWFISTLKQS